MARIPKEELDRLKREISVQALVESKGVVLKRHGSDLTGLCPFHHDKEPSLVVSPRKNLWHCLGACQTGGSVIDWVMKAEGISFRHATELLRKGLPESKEPSTSDQPQPKPAKHSTVRKMPSPLSMEAEDQELLSQVVEYYHQALKESPEALQYLEQRDLTSQEMIDHFKLGFADRTLSYRLPAKNRKVGAKARSRLQQLGILRQSGHEHFNGCVVIPVMDEQARVKEIYGRKITQNLRKGTPLHLYLPGPHRGIWNVQAVQTNKEIILCESLIDALTFWCAGFANVTASYGIEGFTKEMLQAFKKHKTERVLIAYDRDEPGDKAAKELADKLMAEGIDCYRLQFPKGMDANEYATKVQPASKSLGILIRSAVWLGKGKRLTQAPAPSTDKPEEAATKEKDPPDQTEPQPQTTASPVTAQPSIKAHIQDHEVTIRLGDRRYRIRGLLKNLSYELMKVNLLVACKENLHVDTLDLYSARQRSAFVKQAAAELGVKETVIKKDLSKVLVKLEELQEEQIKKTLQPKHEKIIISEQDQKQALELLKDPNLLDRILNDFEACGVVGEQTNKLTGYLATISRKLEGPLAVIIQSTSAAGKTSLMEAVLAFVPEEERVKYSAMTGQSLFYMGECNLKHKVLAIVEEEGAERASYALKLLQSEKELTIASTGKDPDTGRLVTHEYRVEGPVMILLTTTAVEIEDELQNRCIVLTVDEEREQTRAIHKLQRQSQTLEGLLARKSKEQLLKVHQNAQRLLKPLYVVNPYAQELTFLDDRTRTRRDHVKYLTLILSIALLHQYQRPIKTIEHNGRPLEYIEATLEDIKTANRLSHQVLGRSLDELSPQTRWFLTLLDTLVGDACKELGMDRCDYRFTRRQVREQIGWSDYQIRTHLDKLVQLEYVLVHHGGRGQQFVYELAYDGEGKTGEPFLMGLLDVNQLQSVKTHAYDLNPEHSKPHCEHQNRKNEPSSSPQRASIEPPLRCKKIFVTERIQSTSLQKEATTSKNALKGVSKNHPSYPQISRTVRSPGPTIPLAATESDPV